MSFFDDHPENQPLSELSCEFKIAEIDQLEEIARFDLGLDNDEGGILRIAGHRHNRVLVTIPFQLLIERLKQLVHAEHDEQLVVCNIQTVEESTRFYQRTIMSLRKRCRFLRPRPLGHFRKIKSLEEQVRSLEGKLKKRDAKYNALDTTRINLNAERDALFRYNREILQKIIELETEAEWQKGEIEGLRERLEEYEPVVNGATSRGMEDVYNSIWGSKKTGGRSTGGYKGGAYQDGGDKGNGYNGGNFKGNGYKGGAYDGVGCKKVAQKSIAHKVVKNKAGGLRGSWLRS